MAKQKKFGNIVGCGLEMSIVNQVVFYEVWVIYCDNFSALYRTLQFIDNMQDYWVKVKEWCFLLDFTVKNIFLLSTCFQLMWVFKIQRTSF